MTPRFEANGWQGVVADQFTFASLRLVTQAICNQIRHLQSVIDNFPPRLVVGYDNRFMGQHFAEIAAEVILQNGLDIFFVDRPAPTPVVAWGISDRVSTGALILTGADEAYQYNGVKFITSRMAIASEDTTADIEAELERLSRLSHPLQVTPNAGEQTLFNPKPSYFRQMAQLVDLEKVAQMAPTTVVDYLHGAASGYLRELLRPFQGDVQELQNAPLPDFGGLVPALLPDNVQEIQQSLRALKDPMGLGLVLDGDGSNLQVLDHEGRMVAHEQIFALLLDYLVREHHREGGVVKPTRKNDLPERVAARLGVPVHFSATSDFRVITTTMVQEMGILAGDGLGGFAFEGHIMERDGLLTALLLMELMAVRQQPLTEQLAQLSH